MSRSTITLLVLLLAVPVLGQMAQKPTETTFRSMRGEDLVGICKYADASDRGDASEMCINYIAGFTDGYGAALVRFNNNQQSMFCPPHEVTPSQIAKVVVKYGKDHPNLLWMQAAIFTSAALKDAYPCKD